MKTIPMPIISKDEEIRALKRLNEKLRQELAAALAEIAKRKTNQ